MVFWCDQEWENVHLGTRNDNTDGNRCCRMDLSTERKVKK